MGKLNDQRLFRMWRPDADIAAFAIIAVAVTVIAIIESYTNQLAYFLAHGVLGWRAVIAPGAVDTFIVMGELLIYASLRRGWDKLILVWGLVLAAWGFLLSVGANVWHSASASVIDHVVSAIWPVTAAAGMAGVLLIVKRVAVARKQTAAGSETISRELEPQSEPRPQRPQQAPGTREVAPATRRSPARSGSLTLETVSPDVRAALAEGASARKLTELFPELGSRMRTQPLVNDWKAMALNGHGSAHLNGDGAGEAGRDDE
jgi:hypothetical protein